MYIENKLVRVFSIPLTEVYSNRQTFQSRYFYIHIDIYILSTLGLAREFRLQMDFVPCMSVMETSKYQSPYTA